MKPLIVFIHTISFKKDRIFFVLKEINFCLGLNISYYMLYASSTFLICFSNCRKMFSPLKYLKRTKWILAPFQANIKMELIYYLNSPINFISLIFFWNYCFLVRFLTHLLMILPYAIINHCSVQSFIQIHN